MTRARSALALVVALTLVLGACGGDGDEEADATDGTEGAATTPFEAPDGAAATVEGVEVASTDVEAIFDQLTSAEGLEERLEGEGGAQLQSLLRSQILSQLIVKEIVVRAAAEDFGIEVAPDEVEARIGTLAEQAGGEEALAEQLAASGISREMLRDLELPLTMTLEEVQAVVAEGAEPAAPPAEGADPAAEDELSPAELALQAWGVEQFEAADVTVDAAYGTWNPQRGLVEAEPAA